MLNEQYGGHKPLEEGEEQIRVLQVLGQRCQTSEGDSIVCSLKIVNLADANPFYALSYVWGQDTPDFPLWLEGRLFFVRKNLWLFLQALRQRFCSSPDGLDNGRAIYVWADSICIDQSNMKERNHQVSLMGQLYRAADAVYAWLGDSSTEHDDGMKCIEEIRQMRSCDRPWTHIQKQHQTAQARLCSVASASYWSRLWIKQEVLLAKEIWFLFGADVAHWKDMLFAVTLNRDSKAKTSLNQQTIGHTMQQEHFYDQEANRAAMVSLLRSRASPENDLDLPELVHRFRAARCQDPRDRIYALLSLVDESIRRQITVDYSKPVFQVLLETYSLWATDEVSRSYVDLNGSGHPILQCALFCAQMARLLPSSDLLTLFRSKDLRQEIVARGIFVSAALTRITSAQTIATFDADEVHTTLKPQSHGWIIQVASRPILPAKAHHHRHMFMYAREELFTGDILAPVGSTIFVLRNDGTRNTLITMAAEIQSVSLSASAPHQLKFRYLEHPCKWITRQLDDTAFELADYIHVAPGTSDNLSISCNAAVMVSILMASSQYKSSIETHDNPEKQIKNGRDGMKVSGLLQNGDQTADLWSPYVFGIQNKILDSCVSCRLATRNGVNTLGSSASNSADVCHCVWCPELVNEYTK